MRRYHLFAQHPSEIFAPLNNAPDQDEQNNLGRNTDDNKFKTTKIQGNKKRINSSK